MIIEIGFGIWESGFVIGDRLLEIEDLDCVLGLGIWDQGWEQAIEIGDWNLDLGLRLGIDFGVKDWRLGIRNEIGYYGDQDQGLGIRFK